MNTNIIEIIKGANTLSLKDKYEKALIGAQYIVDTQEGFGVVNSLYKEIYMTTILASDYLHIIDLDKDHILSIEQYDELKRRNIIGRVRAQNCSKIRAIFRDYAIFSRMLNTEIRNELAVRNDVLNRFSREVELNATPEAIEHLAKQAQDMIDELDIANKSELKGGIDG